MKRKNKYSAALLTGIHSVSSALVQRPSQLLEIQVVRGSQNSRLQELCELAKSAAVPLSFVSRDALDKLSDGGRHQDVVAWFEASNIYSEKQLDQVLDAALENPLILILDGVQDPHNLGACIRTAEAAGVAAVIYPKDKSANITPVARRAAAGAAEVIPLIEVTNLARVLKQLKQRGIWLAGTSDQAHTDIYQVDLKGGLGLVMGSEGSGMRRLTEELCDYTFNIPMAGSVSSLNVSVATGICLFEALRQRGSME